MSFHQSRDETSVYYAAQALNVVQKAYGVIPRIVGKGDAAEVSFRATGVSSGMTITR